MHISGACTYVSGVSVLWCVTGPLSWYSQLSYWVSSEVCSTPDPHSRGAIIEKFIEVAKVRWGWMVVGSA